MKKLLLIASIFFCGILYAQQTNIWKFGNGAGLDFNSGSPVALPASGQWALEGTASACDANGNLLFYTNGNEVRDRNGNLMPNGSNLTGGTSATQCVAIPKPGTCSQYYIFHVHDHSGTGELRYSLVDMCLNGGFGDVDVSEKNVFLNATSAEKFAAVRHSNGTDAWVITHDLGSAVFRVFPVTAAGVGTPVTTTTGSSYAPNCMIGSLKASHNGQKIVSENTFCNLVELFDFDASTGVVSNMVDLVATLNLTGGYYGAEFSPNDQLLYLSCTWVTNYLIQVDLSSMTMTQLVSQSGNYIYGQLQLGPDGKIYMARGAQSFLDVISNPDIPGAGCNYTPAGVTLAAGTFSDMGLPNFVADLPLQAAPQQQSVTLGNDTLLPCVFNPFTLAPPPGCLATYLWQDGSSGASFVVNGPGVYWVEITSVCGTGRDTIIVGQDSGAISIDLGNDTVFPCNGNAFPVSPGTISGATYLWQDNSTGASFTVTGPGIYWVEVQNACGTDRDTIVVSAGNSPSAPLNAQVITCFDYLFFTDTLSGGQFTWDFGDGQSGQGGSVAHAYGSGGTFTVTLIADFGAGCSDTVITSVDVSSAQPPMSVPNVFTPNADGINDEFIITGLVECTPFTLEIYDRWGVLLFTTEHPVFVHWTGKSIDNKPVPDGVYYYTLSSAAFTTNGFVTLIR